MPTVVGLYAPEQASSHATSLWQRLTHGLGTPAAAMKQGPFDVAVFPEHDGDVILCPDPKAATAGLAVGFGGSERISSTERLVPPWILCRWDETRRTAFVETDRCGFALLYTRSLGDCIVFSTSAVRLGDRVEPCAGLDPSALAELLAFDHLLGERTMRREVKAIPRGCILEIGPAGMSFRRQHRYGDPPIAPILRRNETIDELVALFREGLTDALATRGEKSAVVPLSGGLDSRLLVAAAVEAGTPVEAFTFARIGVDPPDVLIAERVCQELGVPWKRVVQEDDFWYRHADVAIRQTDGQLNLMHAHVSTMLNAVEPGHLWLDGLAGDVVLGGSFLKKEFVSTQQPLERVELLWRTRSRLSRPAWIGLLLPSAREDLVERARTSLTESIDPAWKDDCRWSDFWILQNRIRRFTTNGAAMVRAVGRPVFPFFAPRFIDRLLAIHPRDRINSALQASFFWRAFPRMAAIPWQKLGWPIPRGGIIERIRRKLSTPPFPPNKTFFDADAVFRASDRLRSFVREMVLDPSLGIGRFGYFDVDAVARLIDDVEAGRSRGATQIALLLTLVLSDRHWSKGT